MKTLLCSTLLRYTPGLLAALLILAMPLNSLANVNMTLNLDRYNGNFSGSIYLFGGGASSPVTYHRVESPNGIIFVNSDFSAQSSTNLSFSALLNECTNGLWTLTTNVGDPSEEQYGFSVSISGVASNMFGDTSITNPAYNAAVPTNQPLIEWTSTSLFPEVHIQVHNGVQPPEPGNWVNMVAPVNSWTPPSPVLGGTNFIYLAYQTNGFAGITITTPTNGSGTALADTWVADGDLSSYDFSEFAAPGGGGGCSDPFNAAVECPGFTWNTYGIDPWFVSTLETSVGSSALQSGALDYESSTIEATVQGPGTVSFDWALFADSGDSFDFQSYDDSTGDDSDYFFYYGSDTYGWDSYFVTLSSNDTYTFTWTFYNDDDTAGDYDAAFLDNVIYSGTGGGAYEAEFEIQIKQVVNGASTYYLVFPGLNNTLPVPSTINEVESPNGYCSATETSASSAHFATLQAAINEIEGGDWTLYFDRYGASHEYTFTITVNSLSTNDLPTVTILDPLDGATGVATNSDFQWMGPSTFDSLFVLARDVEASTTLGYESLAATETIWTNGPTLSVGTNSISVSYTSNNFSGLTISQPKDISLNSISVWSTLANLGTEGKSQFVVGSGFVPMPVTLLQPMVLGGNLGLSFVSQSGATHWVEYSTNLVTGPWMPATNFPGDGTTNMVTLPTTNPAAYYRIGTQ